MSFNPPKWHIVHVTGSRKHTHSMTIPCKGKTEYCWHSNLPRGRAIISPHLQQTNGKGGSKSQQNSQLHQKNCHHILVWSQTENSLQDAGMTTNGIQHLHHRPPHLPHTQLLINKLERVQCNAMCWVTGEYKRMVSVTDMMAKLGWETLEVRRSKIRLSMFYKTAKLIIKTSALRKPPALNILQLHERAVYYHYSFYPWTIPLSNVMSNMLV